MDDFGEGHLGARCKWPPKPVMVRVRAIDNDPIALLLDGLVVKKFNEWGDVRRYAAVESNLFRDGYAILDPKYLTEVSDGTNT